MTAIPDPHTLDVDLGNSAMKYRFGSFTGAVAHRADGSVDLSASELAAINRGSVKRIRAGSVMGAAHTQRFADEASAAWGVEVEFARSVAAAGGVTNGYARPETLGVDRWLAVLAAYQKWRKAVLVVDLGTAVTLDYVDDMGRHLGGYIVPGSHLMQSSLLKDTAAIDFQQSSHTLTPPVEPGESTAQAVLRGALLTLKHLIDCGPPSGQFCCLTRYGARWFKCCGAVKTPNVPTLAVKPVTRSSANAARRWWNSHRPIAM